MTYFQMLHLNASGKMCLDMHLMQPNTGNNEKNRTHDEL